MSETRQFSRDHIVALSRRLEEPAWLLDMRLAAYEQWQETPLPSREEEAWRRTDFGSVDFAAALPLLPNGAVHRPESPHVDAVGVLEFVDGSLSFARLGEEQRSAGVVLTSLHEALRTAPDLVQEHFMREAVRPDEDHFTLLHAAFFESGAFCYVPAGVELVKPLFARVSLSAGAVTSLHHSLVILEDRASAAFVEEYQGGGVGGVAVPVSELLLRRGARLRYTAVQRWHSGMAEIAYRRAVTGEDSTLELGVETLGGRLAKGFVGAVMAGRGSDCYLSGLYYPQSGQHVDLTTLQDHRVPSCTSDLLFKGALSDRSQSVFRGVVRVHPHAQQTDAYQTNNNLLLGHEARADSMPVLEIEADDVRCSHGATLAHLNEEDLFYLTCRGLPRAEAQRMVIAGYFEPVLERIPLQEVRDRVAAALAERIDQAG